MRARMMRHVSGAFAGLPQPGLAQASYNLPLLLAFDVLKQALMQAEAEDHFHSESDALGALMAAAKDKIEWIDYDALFEAEARRNAIAHDGKLFDADVCLRDIESIENQLHAWNVLQGEIRDVDSYIIDE